MRGCSRNWRYKKRTRNGKKDVLAAELGNCRVRETEKGRLRAVEY